VDLPINIDHLLHGRSVESERLEFKEGWNPLAVLHTLCAFANDFHNWGGGYILIGVAEENGRPVLPPAGLELSDIDRIQKEILALGHRLVPDYHPVMAPCEVNGRHILVLWAGGGQSRPYKAPVSLSKGCREYAYYIRRGSATVRARPQDEAELINLAATVPFDDRIQHSAKLDDLDLGLIRSYLQRIGSDLFAEAHKMDFLHLCRRMNIIDGPDEFVRPKNAGLMFFNEHPETFFPQTQIDVVQFPDGPGADTFTETIFRGPLDHILREALRHIESTLILEKVIKHPDRPQATRCFNYPMAAIEECLCNAIYHRSYEIREPVEVRILPDRLTIGSFPGPDRSISDEDLKAFRFLSRRYRNRRIGEFLKELDMTEGRGTGIPKVLHAIRANGSPEPIFHTDADRTFFLAEFPLHPAFEEEPAVRTEAATARDGGEVAGDVTPQVTRQAPDKYPTSARQVLSAYDEPSAERSRAELQEAAGFADREHFVNEHLKPLLEAGLLEMTIPDKPRSSKQKYRLTAKGRQFLALRTETPPEAGA
jgi:ATP-dependent DNA helicase RecG